jgi:hypothetical protein
MKWKEIIDSVKKQKVKLEYKLILADVKVKVKIVYKAQIKRVRMLSITDLVKKDQM